MSATDELLLLVRSLQPSERRYFKLNVHRHLGDSHKLHCEKLFDALAEWKDEEYSDALLKKKHRGKSFLTHLPMGKVRLRQLILKTMRSYNSGRDQHIVLSEMLIDIRFLVAKGLREQAHQLITEALVIVQEKQMFAEILILNDQLLQLYPVSPASAPYTAKFVAESETKALQHINLTRQAAHLKVKLFELEATGQWKKKNTEVKAIIKEAKKLLPKCGELRQAELYLINTLQLYLLLEHHYKECLAVSQSWFDKVNRANTWNEYSTRQIRTSLGNHLHTAFKCEDFTHFPQTIKQLKELHTESKTDEVENFRLTTQYELLYLLNTRNFDKSTPLLKAIEEGLKHHRSYISERQLVHFRYNLALLEFFKKSYNQSLKHLRLMYTDAGRNPQYEYIMVLARSLEWLCDAIEGNYETLGNKLRNLQNYINSHYQKVDILQTMLQLFTVIEQQKSYCTPQPVAIKNKLSKAKWPVEWEQLQGMITEGL